MKPQDLVTLRAAGIQRATFFDILQIGGPLTEEEARTFAELEARVNTYLTPFAKPNAAGDCLACGARLTGFLLGSFRWGLAHGEGFCSECSYPARAYHRPSAGEFFQAVLQYHPDVLTEK